MAWWDDLDLGVRVDRPAEILTATATPGDPFFTISGGMVLLTGLIGIITTAPGGAQTISFELNPDVAACADVVLCTPTSIAAATLGDVVTISGDPTDPLINGHLASNLMMEDAPNGVALAPGVLGCVIVNNVGWMRWVLWYKPADTGATVVLA
uniref:Uncharacterized protein n=1 Tax=viral metagenome TaxID=1070528 RepID=A0A6H1Z8D2_9ZZZZ